MPQSHLTLIGPLAAENGVARCLASPLMNYITAFLNFNFFNFQETPSREKHKTSYSPCMIVITFRYQTPQINNFSPKKHLTSVAHSISYILFRRKLIRLKGRIKTFVLLTGTSAIYLFSMLFAAFTPTRPPPLDGRTGAPPRSPNLPGH
jgi:hypothetical protein